MKSIILTILFLLAAVFGAITSAPAASLRTNVVVEGDVVRLGDIFEDAGPQADVVVIYAPAPGRRVSLDAGFLANVASAYQVAWRPLSRADRTIVERAGKIITTAELLAPLTRELAVSGMPAHSVVEFANRSLELSVPLDASSIVRVSNLTYDRQGGRFNAIFTIGDTTGGQRLSAQGRVYPAVSVVVLRRTIGPGEIIRKDDLDIVYRREDAVNRDVVTDPARLIGSTPRQRMRAGDTVRDGDARPPVLVSRNANVVIRLQSGSMTLTSQGRALEEGSRGDIIRVTNMQGGKTIEATVIGPDQVEVRLGARLANVN